MQLLYNFSTEDSGCFGLGILEGNVSKIKDSKDINVPNVGWREINIFKKKRLFKNVNDKPIFYFVHSYFCKSNDRKIVLSSLNYGEEFDVAVESENIFATEFHPEKSQKLGIKVLENFAKI